MSNKRNSESDAGQPRIYQIRIEGHLGPQWMEWFDGLTITLGENGDTLLTGPVVDQAALHGILKKIRDLGMPLLSVNSVETYFCPQSHKELRTSDCPKLISAKQAEAQVWEKVTEFITNPAYLLAEADAKASRLQKDYEQMQQEGIRLHKELKRLNDERQEFITKARKERMPDEEFTPQINALYEQERGVQRRLTTIERTKDDFTKLDLEEQIKKYVAELRSEMVELIHADPQTPEERHQVFLLKKRVVDTVLKEARIDQNREIHMKFRSDFTTRTN